jgi:hypothetical protein
MTYLLYSHICDGGIVLYDMGVHVNIATTRLIYEP